MYTFHIDKQQFTVSVLAFLLICHNSTPGKGEMNLFLIAETSIISVKKHGGSVSQITYLKYVAIQRMTTSIG